MTIVWDGAEGPVWYEPTQDDVVWLQRAVEGEGPVESEVAQVLVNRFAYLWQVAQRVDGTPFYPTIAALAQAYAQPINPRWMEGGDKYEDAWASARTDQRRDELRARHALRKAHRELQTFSDKTRAAVRGALTTPPTIPAAWLHYSAPGTGRKGLPVLTPPVKGRNQMFGVNGAGSWAGYRMKNAGAALTPTRGTPSNPIDVDSPLQEPPEELKSYAPVVLLLAALWLLTRKK